MTRHRYPDVVLVACDDTEGVYQPAAVFHVDRQTKLGCGCTRLEGNRPGPPVGDNRRMQALTGCRVHPYQVLAGVA